MKVICQTIDELFDHLTIKDGLAISFHHHLRNGDGIINKVLTKFESLNTQDISLYPSSIFPSYTKILDLLKNGQITHITTNYLNGPVASYLAEHSLEGILKMQTHGGRARAFIEGENQVDIAFIAAPACDKQGNATGIEGKNACGSLGYAIEDSKYAKTKVLITDTLLDELKFKQIDGADIDFILVLDSIGDAKGIVSGTTAITNDPVGVKIAKNASELIKALDLVQEGFSFQSGAGGVSLRVTQTIKKLLKEKKIQASFFSGGITKYHVEMLEEGLVKMLYDVQCFDLEAINSLKKNKNHYAISANTYANPSNPNRIIKDLDVVILGATEIDLEFNVNVTTDSYNLIIGGSGGHSDTATDAKVTIIVTPLLKARTPIIKQQVNTITTLGKNIDCIVTERGIAINPNRKDLLDKLKGSKLDIVSINALMDRAHQYTGIPQETIYKGIPLGVVEDRDGVIIDTLYTKR
ncbi:MAG: citrate lyase subunit alpha [Candidatus Izemoplasmataceae bacterium]